MFVEHVSVKTLNVSCVNIDFVSSDVIEMLGEYRDEEYERQREERMEAALQLQNGEIEE